MSGQKRPRKPVVEIPVVLNEPISLIQQELDRFQNQVNDILAAMESINLVSIQDAEERLKATNTKVMISLKLPQLLASLDDLKNRAKLKSEDIKGSKDISPLEGGMLN